MREIERRLQKLEQTKETANWLTMTIDERPTDDQQAEIDQAIAANDLLFVFVEKGDTCWVAGLGAPPWEQPPSSREGYN